MLTRRSASPARDAVVPFPATDDQPVPEEEPMKILQPETQIETTADTRQEARFDRRKFVRNAGYFGLGAAVSGLVLAGSPARAQSEGSAQSMDSFTEIVTAFLIAEDLASTFYYNGLIGPVIQNPNLAGPGGSANNVTTSGNAGNVNYLQAALTQEIVHANLFRTGLGTMSPMKDPYQKFYFPNGTFNTLPAFLGILNALEDAFIGAYLVLIQEMATKSALASSGKLTGGDKNYSAAEYEYFGKIAGSILGVESEHRVLGRVIGNNNPANNISYEQTDGLQSIYNGPHSAVVALTPFLTPNTGPGYSLETALKEQSSVSLPSSGTVPPQ
jgi:hypothetical protein